MSEHGPDQWEIEADLDAIQRVIEIKADPQRMNQAQEMLQDKQSDLAKLMEDGFTRV